MPSLNLRKKISTLLHSHPYPLPFNSYSSSQKSFITSILHDVSSHLSGNQPNQLYNYFFKHSLIGKTYFPDSKHITKTKQILNNLKIMHLNASTKYKFSLLSLIAGLYSRSELKNLGFHFSNTQFNTSLKKAKNQSFFLSNYQRYISPSKSIITKQTIELILNSLLQNSRLSTITCQFPKLLFSLENISTNFNPTSIYYLEKTKKTIYFELKTQNPSLKLSLGTFYKYCPSNFKKAQKNRYVSNLC